MSLLPKNPVDRRRFLQDAARGAAGCAVAGLGLAWLAREARALPAEALRPPGALPEDDFLSACIRCGLCVRDCPYNTLSLAELGEDGAATGTPFFTARTIPCEMCDDIPCVAACPTGALDHALTSIDDARMGTAVLVDHENCLNWQGLRCDVCYRVCPVIDKAITLERQHDPRSGHHAKFIPTVWADHCTGCGKCEKSCVLPEAAIKVLPVRLARGAPAGHYRKGWEEKEKAGGALVETVDLPDRLPDGMVAPGVAAGAAAMAGRGAGDGAPAAQGGSGRVDAPPGAGSDAPVSPAAGGPTGTGPRGPLAPSAAPGGPAGLDAAPAIDPAAAPPAAPPDPRTPPADNGGKAAPDTDAAAPRPTTTPSAAAASERTPSAAPLPPAMPEPAAPGPVDAGEVAPFKPVFSLPKSKP